MAVEVDNFRPCMSCTGGMGCGLEVYRRNVGYGSYNNLESILVIVPNSFSFEGKVHIPCLTPADPSPVEPGIANTAGMLVLKETGK